MAQFDASGAPRQEQGAARIVSVVSDQIEASGAPRQEQGAARIVSVVSDQIESSGAPRQEQAAARVITGPYVRNHSPYNLPECITPAGVTSDFEIVATGGETVDLTTVVVLASFSGGAPVTVYDGGAGGFQAGYTGSVTNTTTAAEDIQAFSWAPSAGFVSGTVEITVTGADSAAATITPDEVWLLTFCAETDPPFVINEDPAPLEIVEDLTTDIQFDILDLGRGVDLTSLDVSIDISGVSSVAIIGGVFQAGFTGTITAITDGYRVVINPDDDLEAAQTIQVTIDAQDLEVPTNVMPTVVYTFYTPYQNPKCKLATCRITSVLGTVIQLDGRESVSLDDVPITFEWKFIQVPRGSVLEPDLDVINPASMTDLRNPDYAAISFIPDVLGDYLVQLTVRTGYASSELPCTALVQVGLSRALCGAGRVPDASFMWSFISNFWGLVEDRRFIESIWSAQIQLVGAEIVKLWSNDYNKSLSTIQPTVQRHWQYFNLETDLSAKQQRVIVGNTKAGTTGNTGPLAGGGGATTTQFHTLTANDDLTTIDINYGAKGRLIDINGSFFTLERVFNVTTPSVSSVAVVQETTLVNGQTNVPYRLSHLIHVPGFDLEAEGVMPGDTLYLEWTRGDTGATAEMPVRVSAVLEDRIGFEFTTDELVDGVQPLDYDLFRQVVQDLRIVPPAASDFDISTAANALIAFVPTGINISQQPFSVFRLRVKASRIRHNTRKAIDPLFVSIPFLQEEVKEDPDVILRENFDYYLEDGFLVFDSSLFSTSDPAPEALWAECTHVDNTPAVEANFGRLVDLSPDDLAAKATRAPYLGSVKGLWYALTNGPTVANVRLGLQILMGLPFSEERGKIIALTHNFSTDTFGNPIGRLLVEDVDYEDRGTGVRRFYFFPEIIGLEINPLTKVEWAVGDIIPAFTVLSKGIEVTDYIKDPLWWIRTLANNEVKKLFLFKAQIDTDTGVFDENDLAYSLEFIRRIKPVYTDVVATVLRQLDDDVLDAFDDVLTGVVRQRFYDNVGHFGAHESTFRSNDLNHQGITLWRGDSRPFSSRTTQVLRNVTTAQNGANVEASSPGGGFTGARARITGAAGVPTVEGDLLAIWPTRPGAGALTPKLYEIATLAGVNGPAVLTEAPTGDPTTLVPNAPDANLFAYSQVQTGAAASVITGADAYRKRVSGLTGMTEDSVGRELILSSSGDNDGVFRIVAYVDANNVDVFDPNPGTIPDANNGSIAWVENEPMGASVVRRAVNPKVIGTDLATTAGSPQLATSAGGLLQTNGVGIDDHLIIESGANAGEYRIVSIVAQTIPRDYTPSGVPQISETTVGLVNLDGTNPALADLGSQSYRIISPVMLRTRVSNASILQSGGNMFAEVVDAGTTFPFDVFTPGMVGEELVVTEAENPLNNGNYTIVAYVNPGRVQITTGSPQTSDATPQAVLSIRSQYHPGFERAEELAPLEVFSAVVT